MLVFFDLISQLQSFESQLTNKSSHVIQYKMTFFGQRSILRATKRENNSNIPTTIIFLHMEEGFLMMVQEWKITWADFMHSQGHKPQFNQSKTKKLVEGTDKIVSYQICNK